MKESSNKASAYLRKQKNTYSTIISLLPAQHYVIGQMYDFLSEKGVISRLASPNIFSKFSNNH